MNRFFSLTVIVLSLAFVGCATSSIEVKGPDASGQAVAPEAEKYPEAKMEIREIVLDKGDSIVIEVFKHDELERTVDIDSGGIIMMPLIGDVQVLGKSVTQLRDEIRDRLAKYIVDPQVIITVKGLKSKKVLVMGEVKSPGVFNLDYDLRVSEAIVRAGGLTEDAKQSEVLLIRRKKEGGVEVSEINFKDVYKGRNYDFDKLMVNGDIIYVPPKEIALTARFMNYIGSIVGALTNIESGIILWPDAVDVLMGKEVEKQTIIAQ